MKHRPAGKDPRGGHVRLYWTILDSPAWRALSHADVRVYLAMRRKLGRTNNGDINATLADLRHAGISSSSTLSAALHRLEAVGFIAKTRQGGITFGGKLCSLYRFTDVETFDIAKAGVKAGPPSNDWQRIKTLAEARAAVLPFNRKNASKVRTSKRSDSTTGPERLSSDPTVEREAISPIRRSKRNDQPTITLQPA